MSEENAELVSLNEHDLRVAILKTVEGCTSFLDGVVQENKMDAAQMIMVSVNVAAHLMARNILFANGPKGRDDLCKHMLSDAAEIINDARNHVDISERELNNTLIRPN